MSHVTVINIVYLKIRRSVCLILIRDNKDINLHYSGMKTIFNL